MAGIRGKDTKPEKAVRSFLHGAGLRFRLHDRSLSGNPDIVLRKFNAVVFVHGCFWHLHSQCGYARLPGGTAVRRAFWRKKLQGNKRRDIRSARTLLASGMRVAVFWECAIRGPGRDPRALGRLLHWIRGRRRFVEIRGR